MTNQIKGAITLLLSISLIIWGIVNPKLANIYKLGFLAICIVALVYSIVLLKSDM